MTDDYSMTRVYQKGDDELFPSSGVDVNEEVEDSIFRKSEVIT